MLFNNTESNHAGAAFNQEEAAELAKAIEAKRGIPADEVMESIRYCASLGIDLSNYESCRAWELTDEETLRLKKELETRERKKQETVEERLDFLAKKSGLGREIINERYRIACEERYKDFWFIIDGIYLLSNDEIRAHKHKEAHRRSGLGGGWREEQDEKHKKMRKAMRKEMSWNRAQARLAFLTARNKCGCSMIEFLLYGIYKMNDDQAKTMLTGDVKRRAWLHNATAFERSQIFQDKLEFSKAFPEFLNRACFANTELSYDEFLENIKGEEKIVYKVRNGAKGVGMQILDVNGSDEQNREVYEHLVSLPPGVVEGFIKQHKSIAEFYSGSVNTIRVITALKDGKAEIAMAGLRVGTKGNVDNFAQGGISASIDPESGIIETDGANGYGERFVNHPVSGKQFRGFQIPHWDEIVKCCCEEAEKCQDMPFIGWDVALLEDGRVALVEGNLNFDTKVVQTPCALDGIGVRDRLEKYL